MTLIGTPPNLIVSDTLQNAGYAPLSFFSFLPVGLVTLTVGVLGLLPLTKIFLAPKDAGKKKQSSGKSLDDLVGEYGLTHNLFRVHIKNEQSEAINKSIAELNIYHNYGINVLELRRSSGQKSRGGLFLPPFLTVMEDLALSFRTTTVFIKRNLVAETELDELRNMEMALHGSLEIHVIP